MLGFKLWLVFLDKESNEEASETITYKEKGKRGDPR
jgi:hypothetical protein